MAAVMLQQFSLSASSLGGQQGLVKQHMGKGDQISGAAVASARRVKLIPPGRRWTTRLTAGRAGVRGVVVTAMSSGNLDRHDGVLSDEDKRLNKALRQRALEVERLSRNNNGQEPNEAQSKQRLPDRLSSRRLIDGRAERAQLQRNISVRRSKMLELHKEGKHPDIVEAMREDIDRLYVEVNRLTAMIQLELSNSMPLAEFDGQDR